MRGIIEGIVKHMLNVILRLLHLELTDDLFDSIMQFVKFGLVGISNTFVSYLVYIFSLLMIRRLNLFAMSDIFVAPIIAYILSVLWSFLLNNRFVFRKNRGKKELIKALVKTYTSYFLSGIVINLILLHIQVNLLGVSEFVAPIINLMITVPINFILNKYWAFK